MSKKSKDKPQIMTVGALKSLLNEFEVQDDFAEWLSQGLYARRMAELVSV